MKTFNLTFAATIVAQLKFSAPVSPNQKYLLADITNNFKKTLDKTDISYKDIWQECDNKRNIIGLTAVSNEPSCVYKID